MLVPVGATTYVFRYLIADASRAPGPHKLLEMAHAAGLERLQICENARPLDIPGPQWQELRRVAGNLGLEITFGCMTLDEDIVFGYLDRVQATGGCLLRIVLEREGEKALRIPQIRDFLDRLIPALQSRGVRLAIENHFAIPSKVLAEAVAPYSASTIGFCVDIANSLRNFEDAFAVLDLLGDRAFCYHLKDYRISGSNVGFTVSGAPFGEGQIDAAGVLDRVFAHTLAPEVYLETWTPTTGDRESDAALDTRWLEISINNLRGALASAQSRRQSRVPSSAC